MSNTELKPCPFCGGKDLRTGNTACLIGTDIYIKCTCGAKIQICKEFGKEESGEEEYFQRIGAETV